MYNNLIKKLLSETFGPPHKTLATSRSTGKSKDIYYYELPIIDEINAMKSVLEANRKCPGIGKFPTLLQKFDECYECAVLSENLSGWSISFFEIDGCKYHTTNGQHIEATLILSKHCCQYLTERYSEKLFFGYWSIPEQPNNKTQFRRYIQTKEGFSYWTNRYLRTSSRFKKFTVELYRALGEIASQKILYNIANAIEENGFFLPQISYNDIKTCNDCADVMKHYLPTDDTFDVGFDKYNLNVGYLATRLFPIVEKSDISLFADVASKNLENIISFPTMYYELKIDDILFDYYFSQEGLCDEDEGVFRMICEDYVHFCLKKGKKINLRISDSDEMIHAISESATDNQDLPF